MFDNSNMHNNVIPNSYRIHPEGNRTRSKNRLYLTNPKSNVTKYNPNSVTILLNLLKHNKHLRINNTVISPLILRRLVELNNLLII